MQQYPREVKKSPQELKREKEIYYENCGVAVCCIGTFLQFVVMYLCVKDQKTHKFN